MFQIHGRKWNDIAASLDGRPPVQVRSLHFQLVQIHLTGGSQCRNRWLSLVRAGKIEGDGAMKPELREGSHSHSLDPEPEVCANPFRLLTKL